jgi:hypothetical protein
MRRLSVSILLVCAFALALSPVPHPVAAAAPSPGNPCATQPGSFKLVVDRPGIYAVTQADLQAAGWSGALDVGRLHLYQGACVAANEVALDRAADVMRFYGVPSTSRYSAVSVYWLRQENSAGLSMATRAVAPAGAPVQSTAIVTADGVLSRAPGYDSVYPGDDGDHFFQADVRGGVTMPITFTLGNPASGPAELRLHLQGVTAGQHHLHLTFDGSDLGEQTWSGVTTFTAVIPLGASQLAAGAHRLALSIPSGAIDVVLLDRSVLRYPAQLIAAPEQTLFDGVVGARRYKVGGYAAPSALLYDARDPRRPVRLAGATVAANNVVWQDAPTQPAHYALLAPNGTLHPAITADRPSNLAQGGADYLIVGYGPFLPPTAPLADYYRGKGLRVATVDIQDVYDEFNGGELHPEALRSFLRYAYASWARPAPTYTLLVGDGTYDFRDRLGLGWASFVPPYLADVDPWMIEAACDTCYGRVQTDDPRTEPLPDLLVGRLPVDSVAQASTVISKTLGYLKSPPRGAWQTTTLFMADDPDDAGDFADLSDSAISALPPGISAQRFYYDPTLWPNNKPPRYSVPGDLRDDFFKAFDSGAALVTYTGHANYWQWAYTGENRLPTSGICMTPMGAATAGGCPSCSR